MASNQLEPPKLSSRPSQPPPSERTSLTQATAGSPVPKGYHYYTCPNTQTSLSSPTRKESNEDSQYFPDPEHDNGSVRRPRTLSKRIPLPRASSSKKIDDAMFKVKAMVFIMVGFFVGWGLREASFLTSQDALQPSVRHRIHQSWVKETHEHEVDTGRMKEMSAKWQLEIQEHDAMRLVMVRERMEWDNERQERERIRRAERDVEHEPREEGSGST